MLIYSFDSSLISYLSSLIPSTIITFLLIYKILKSKNENENEETHKIVDFDDLLKHIEYKHSNNLLGELQYINTLVKKINNMVDLETKQKTIDLASKMKELKYMLQDYITLKEWEKESVLENVLFTVNHMKEETYETYEEIKAEKTVELKNHYERKMNDITKMEE